MPWAVLEAKGKGPLRNLKIRMTYPPELVASEQPKFERALWRARAIERTGAGLEGAKRKWARVGAPATAAVEGSEPTSEVLIEESILGWKEYELEVMLITATQWRNAEGHQRGTPQRQPPCWRGRADLGSEGLPRLRAGTRPGGDAAPLAARPMISLPQQRRDWPV
jgi:hypothetical protein